MEFSRQEYWRGWPFPSPGYLLDSGIKFGSPALQAGSLPSETPGKPYYSSKLHKLSIILNVTKINPFIKRSSTPVHPKEDQSWVFIGGTDVEAETPILWPPDAKS